uniref:F-box domain-containing protein n=2 Tax=Triticum urartu TaxID=4572 RepID=A0A8R7QHL5_TRIUA
MANINSASHEDLHQTMMMKPKRKGLQLTNQPKDILCSILSRLPLKEAVRTSILSERWKHLWRCHSNLEFSLRSMFPGPRTNGPNVVRPWKDVFIERVDAVLQQHSGAGVDNIQFQAPCDDEHGDRIEGWVRFAIASKAKQLILDFSGTHHIEQHPYKIDLRLLDDSKSLHLQSIKLSSVSLKVPADFKGFRNLKRIFLADTNITDGDLQHLVSNCTSVLEFLGIAGCGMLTRLQISHLSNKLKHLQVYDCRLLQAMELNFGLAKLEYRGPSI